MNKAPDPKAARVLIHMPDEVASIGRDYLAERRRLVEEGKPIGVPMGIASIDKVLVPPQAGNIVSILARPGNGKTGLAIRWLRWWSRVVQTNPETFPRQYVGFISTEQSVEELNAFMAAAGTGVNIEDMARGRIDKEQWQRIEKWSMERAALPMVMIGHSQARRKARVPLTMDMIMEAVWQVEKLHGMKPALLGLDYLQQVRSLSANQDSKTIAIANNLSQCKDLAIGAGCPLIVTAQAKREVDQKDPPVPGQDDGQWTSNIEQDSDIMFSCVRPIKYRRLGTQFWDFKVTDENMMLVTLLKQRLGPAPSKFLLKFDPRYNQLDEWEESSIRQNPYLDRE